MSATEAATVALPVDTIARVPVNDIHRVLTPQFVRMIRQVHACGPRAVGELLWEVADADALALRLPVYAALDAALVDALDCRDFPDPMLAEVSFKPDEGGPGGWSSLGDVARRVVGDLGGDEGEAAA